MEKQRFAVIFRSETFWAEVRAASLSSKELSQRRNTSHP